MGNIQVNACQIGIKWLGSKVVGPAPLPDKCELSVHSLDFFLWDPSFALFLMTLSVILKCRTQTAQVT